MRKKVRVVKITINTENDAFADGNDGSETARILRNLAERIDGEPLGPNDCRFAMDANGNRVGELRTA